MSDIFSASEEQGNTLLEEMEKTIPQKVAVCAAHMLLKDGAVVLDAGCADGVATAYFALSNPHVNVVGIDYDAQFIQQARHKYGHISNVEFIRDDLRTFDMKERKLDAIVNLSILHEPYSYTGYRKKTVEDIIQAELKNLKPGGVLINRDFVLPDVPGDMVYMALSDSDEESGNSPETMSYSDLLMLFSREAMAFDNGDPQGHIKGFFLEEHTKRVDFNALDLPENWRIFYLPHQFAWEFIWRKEYRDRFFPEANEKYGYWSLQDHKRLPESLGARVSYAAHFENPWILKNWYAPHVALFDKDFQRLPLPPSNFISVIEKTGSENVVCYREHRASISPPDYLKVSSFRNSFTGSEYDLVQRPGGDVVDVLPYYHHEDQITVYAKHNFPRPIINAHPRLMTENLDKKIWSGHITEPLAAANIQGDWRQAVMDLLTQRAGFNAQELPDVDTLQTEKKYYTAPTELNERVRAVYVQLPNADAYEKSGLMQYSGFSSDGSVKAFNAHSLLDAAQVGMLAEARLELNLYGVYRKCGVRPKPWIGGQLDVVDTPVESSITFGELDRQAKSHCMFEKIPDPSQWLDVVRSEFHEIEIKDQRERVLTRQEREFVVPNSKNAQNITTNSVTVFCLVRSEKTDNLLVGVQKIDQSRSQFPSVQEREAYSGLVTVPGFRLSTEVNHVQQIPSWLSTLLNVDASSIQKLGEGYFPSIGVMPNRVFPYVVSGISDAIIEQCEFVELDEVLQNLERIQDMHLLIGLCRIAHATGEL